MQFKMSLELVIISMNIYAFRGIEDSDVDEEDLPVQGPLPQEPEDGPWKKNESGIRKL